MTVVGVTNYELLNCCYDSSYLSATNHELSITATTAIDWLGGGRSRSLHIKIVLLLYNLVE